MTGTNELPQPSRDGVAARYWDSLEAGRLAYQWCAECGNAWLPAREECPRCLSPVWEWRDAAGTGRIVSWVVYHHVYHEAFRDRVPYNVTLVELDEGPRLITNVLGIEGARGLDVDRPVRFVPDREAGTGVARFVLADLEGGHDVS